MRKIVIFLVVAMLLPTAAYAAFDPPPGGWAYIYTGDAAVAGTAPTTSLDGTWDHDNDSDQWDGTIIGAGRPGGASIVTVGDLSYLRLQDTGDPRDYGMGDPGSNRKLYFAHPVTEADLLAGGDGVTLSFRARVPDGAEVPIDFLHPNGGGGIVPYPAAGDGYGVHNEGKGSFGVRDADYGLISFSLATADDENADLNTWTGNRSGLIMNALAGSAVADEVDAASNHGTPNILPLDVTQWHEFWVMIEVDATATGTHKVSVWVDGDSTPRPPDGVFLVTAGIGDDYSGVSDYLAMGMGHTNMSGALDVDFFAYTAEAIPVPEPVTVTLLGLGGLGLLRLRRRQ